MTNSDDRSLTIAQFCAVEQISHPFYFKLRKQGKGPREMREGRLVRISPEARRDWQRERERASATPKTSDAA